MKRFVKYIFPFLVVFWSFIFTVNAQSINDLLVKLENTNQPTKKLSIYKQIAYTYQKEQAYTKSSEYLQKAYELEKEANAKIALQEKIGRNELALKKYTESLKAFEKAYQIAVNQNNTKNQKNILTTMVSIFNQQKNYSQALVYNKKLLALSQKDKDDSQVVQILNNMGVIYQANKQNTEAQRYFQEALVVADKIYEKDKKLPVAQQNSQILSNMAILNNYIGEYKQAMRYLIKAENLQMKQWKPKQQIKTKNLKAITYYLQGDNHKAREEIEEALALNEKMNHKKLLAESYQILAEIQASEGNSQASQDNLKKYLKLKEEIQIEENRKQKKLLDKQIETEKRESQMRQLISEHKHKALELEQIHLENEKKQQALELQKQQLEILQRDKVLQATQFKNQELEKEKVKQALGLAKAKLAEEQRQKKIGNLEKQQKLQALELEKQKLKEAESQKEKELLKHQQKLKDQELKRQKATQLFTNVLLGVGAGILVIILVFFYLNFRKNKRLAQQNEAIRAQAEKIKRQQQVLLKSQQKLQESNGELQVNNEELQQNQEEIASQRDILEQKNAELSDYQYRISKSIESALLIQTSILPITSIFENYFTDHFILYSPKDVVSGDFYWLNEHQKQVILIEADCTGHGVPGAFMTLIGYSILNQIILQEHLSRPLDIMQELHRHIRSSLQQNSTGNLEGMDISILVIHKENTGYKVIFGASGQNLYYTNNGLHLLRGSRRKIGGFSSERTQRQFEEHELHLPEGTKLYLSSDGLIDQNNVKREKFGSKRFRQVLERIQNDTMKKQFKTLQNELHLHQQNELQRDDITVIGVQL